MLGFEETSLATARSFDRSVEDVGNILNLEHFNLTVPDQQLAALFYVTGLGFTRDPYMDFGTFNMWINAGEQQFHLPQKEAQVFRGRIGLVVPDLEDLKRRFAFIERPMQGTCFEWAENNGHIDVTCPWGNQLRVHPAGQMNGMSLGIQYGDMQVAPGTAEGIARFYQTVFSHQCQNGRGQRRQTRSRICRLQPGVFLHRNRGGDSGVRRPSHRHLRR